jgi:elongation factor Ts
MMDCKKALEECQGDMDRRSSGCARRASRAASRARAARLRGQDRRAHVARRPTGALVELNSETDFVARNEAFGQTVEKIADTSSRRSVRRRRRDTEGSPLCRRSSATGTLADTLKQLTGTIGENIVLRRYARFGGVARSARTCTTTARSARSSRCRASGEAGSSSRARSPST